MGYCSRAVGCWVLLISWYILALSKEVVLGIDLRAVECLVRCVFVYILSWLELGAAGAAGCWFCC